MSEAGDQEERQSPRLVRPYTLTGGRSANQWTELRIEALVTTVSASHAHLSLSPEQRTIAHLCRHQLQSVAEISALLKLPLGVVRVLVGEMVDQGALDLYQPSHQTDRPDRALLERVLDGLRRL